MRHITTALLLALTGCVSNCTLTNTATHDHATQQASLERSGDPDPLEGSSGSSGGPDLAPETSSTGGPGLAPSNGSGGGPDQAPPESSSSGGPDLAPDNSSTGGPG